MIRVSCPSSGKALGVKASLAGTVITCPLCKQGHTVPAAETAAPVPPNPAVPALPGAPGGGEARPRPVCVFHPQVPSVVRCSSCRKALCETCRFRSGVRTYCADCASKPDPERAGLANRRGIFSLLLGIGAAVGLVGFFVLSIFLFESGDDKAAELIAGLLFMVPIALAVAGLAMGFMSRDPATGRSGIGLVGLILNLILLIMFLLLTIVGVLMPA